MSCIRYTDFIVDNDDTSETYYWVHCGMLFDASYSNRWKKKLEWYKQNGIVPVEDGDNLIITVDNENGGIDSKQIQEIIEEIFQKDNNERDLLWTIKFC